MDFIPAYNVSRQRIKTAKYSTTTFAYHSTTYLFNDWESSALGTPHINIFQGNGLPLANLQKKS